MEDVLAACTCGVRKPGSWFWPAVSCIGLRRVRRVLVFVDQAVNDLVALEPDLAGVGGSYHWWRRLGRSPVPGPMGPGLVVVPFVLGQHLAQVTLVVDQDPVCALAPCAAYPAFGDRVGARRQLRLMAMIGTGVCG